MVVELASMGMLKPKPQIRKNETISLIARHFYHRAAA
jgi:hypothetical protein